MLPKPSNERQTVAVLFSGGLDSAVLVAHAASEAPVQPIYVSVGLAWEARERAAAGKLLDGPPYRGSVQPMAALSLDMRDVYPATHWAIRGQAPAFDTPDADVYIEGRNIVLLAKASVFMARAGIERVMLGPLAGNPFPDASGAFFEQIGRALGMGLGARIQVEAPFAQMHKADVIRLGHSLGVPLADTLSCMQPVGDLHCGQCSKCRERRDGFIEAGVPDATRYAVAPLR